MERKESNQTESIGAVESKRNLPASDPRKRFKYVSSKSNAGAVPGEKIDKITLMNTMDVYIRKKGEDEKKEFETHANEVGRVKTSRRERERERETEREREGERERGQKTRGSRRICKYVQVQV